MSERPVTGIKQILREVLRTKSGIAGFTILGAMVLIAAATPIYAPFDIASKWNDLKWWSDNPALAAPYWTKYIFPDSVSETIYVTQFKVETKNVEGVRWVEYSSPFNYPYKSFPTEIRLIMDVLYFEKQPRVIVTLLRPDGEKITLYNGAPTNGTNFINISLDSGAKKQILSFLHEKTGILPTEVYPEVVLFAELSQNMNDRKSAKVLRGVYTLNIDYISFEEKGTIRPKFIVYGNVYGLAGTDMYRRDLIVGLMWGAPVALAFGTIAAVVTVLLQVLIGAAGVWFGPKTDELVQRMTDFFLVIPILPILILINVIYTVTIWTLLGWVILFSIVGSVTKVSRSIVLQVKEEQYIEAAMSYGASKKRVLFFHILPRVMPYTFALIALGAPAYIFLEASLSFLGLGDPQIPSWGRILGDAFQSGALYYGYWWWVVFPAFMIMLVSLGFTLLSYAFDKIVNPRLREE